MSTTALAELDTLQATLNASIDAFRAELKAQNMPPLASNIPHPIDEPGTLNPKLYEAKKLVITTLSLLTTLFQSPLERLQDICKYPYEIYSLFALVETGVIDALANAPDPEQGLHIQEIQTQLDIPADKIENLIRLLAGQGWFRETKESVYANTKCSNLLVSGTACNHYIHLNVEMAKTAPAIKDLLKHPEWKYSRAPNHTAFQLAMGTDLQFFDWLRGQPEMIQHFNKAMTAMLPLVGPGTLADYPWQDLKGKTIVDIGGGRGTMSVALAKQYPDLKFVVQDVPRMVEEADAFIASTFPNDPTRVVVEVHDFFTPQTRTGSDIVYFMRFILHNWPDEEAVEILKQVVSVADKKSKILTVDAVIVPEIVKTSGQSAEVSLDSLTGVQQYRAIEPPPYIPMSFGTFSRAKLGLGATMMASLNARERTAAQFEALFKKAGLRLIKVYPLRSYLSLIESEII